MLRVNKRQGKGVHTSCVVINGQERGKRWRSFHKESAPIDTKKDRRKLYSFNEDIGKLKRWSFTKFLGSVCTFLRRLVQLVLSLEMCEQKENGHLKDYTLILRLFHLWTHLVNVVKLKTCIVRRGTVQRHVFAISNRLPDGLNEQKSIAPTNGGRRKGHSHLYSSKEKLEKKKRNVMWH